MKKKEEEEKEEERAKDLLLVDKEGEEREQQIPTYLYQQTPAPTMPTAANTVQAATITRKYTTVIRTVTHSRFEHIHIKLHC